MAIVRLITAQERKQSEVNKRLFDSVDTSCQSLTALAGGLDALLQGRLEELHLHSHADLTEVSLILAYRDAIVQVLNGAAFDLFKFYEGMIDG